jgi:iron complex outermembrane receptor protein
MHRPHVGILVLLLAVLASKAGLAQRSDTVGVRDTAMSRLRTIEVIGSVLSEAGPTSGSGVPARYSRLDEAALRRWNPRHLADAVAGQPGVSLYDDLGSPFKPTLVMRGFTASPVVGLPQGVSVLVDGVPVNEPDAGQVNFDLLPLAHVRQVEVLSGTASLLGPHSLGGAINLLTRRGDGPPSGDLELGLGSYGQRAVQASAGGMARGLSYYGGLGTEREGGWRQLTASRRTDGFVSVGRFGERRGARLHAFVLRSRAETAGSLPASVYAPRPDSNLSAGDFEHLDQLHVAITGYSELSGGRASLVAYHRAHDAERFNVNQVNDPDVRGLSRNRTTGASLDWQRSRAVGPGTLGVRLGAGGSASDVRIRLFAERLHPGITTHVQSPIRKADAYALADFRTGPTALTGGVRFDAVRVPFENRLDSARDTTSTFRRASPRIGVSVELGRGASVHASSGQSFRTPAVIELACADPEEPCPLPFALGDDPPLAPVVATTHELGGQWATGRMLLNASTYRTEVRDDILLFPYSDESEPEGSTLDGYFANVSRTRREGIELAAIVEWPSTTLFLNYGLTRATYQVDAEIFSVRESVGEDNEVEPGDRMPLVPAHTLAVGATHRVGGAELGVETRYTGERWMRGDEANVTRPLPGFWTTQARLQQRLGPWSAELSVRNIFDDRHATFGTFNINQGGGGLLERFLTPGEPRTFRLTLQRRFGSSE